MSTATATARAYEFPWWLVLIQGIAALILGLLLLISPGMTTFILIQFLGIYWLIDGIFSIVRIFIKSTTIHWGWLLVRGILGILAGLVIINNPLWSTLLIPTVLVFILGIYGIFGGIIGLIEGFSGGIKWGAIVLGILSILFGLILIFNQFAAALALPWVIGIFAIVGGIIAIIMAFKMR